MQANLQEPADGRFLCILHLFWFSLDRFSFFLYDMYNPIFYAMTKRADIPASESSRLVQGCAKGYQKPVASEQESRTPPGQ